MYMGFFCFFFIFYYLFCGYISRQGLTLYTTTTHSSITRHHDTWQTWGSRRLRKLSKYTSTKRSIEQGLVRNAPEYSSCQHSHGPHIQLKHQPVKVHCTWKGNKKKYIYINEGLKKSPLYVTAAITILCNMYINQS